MRGPRPLAAVLWLGGAVLLTAVLYVGARMLTDLTPFSLQRIEVKGNVRTSYEAIVETLGLSQGRSLFSLDVSDMTATAKAMPWVKEAKISRRIPDTIIVEIEEWEPAFLVRLDRLYYMSRDGKVINAPLSMGMDYPVVTGVSRYRLEASETDRGRILSALDLVARGAAGDRVDEIHYDNTLGVTVYASGDKPYGVFLGFGDLEEKFSRLGRMKRTLKKKGQYAMSADLSYDDRVVARLAPIEPPGQQGGLR